MNILLLEDDTDAREAMAALLRLDAHDVEQAYDRPSFQRATRELRSQAVIFDLCLADESSGLNLAMEYQRRRQEAGLAPARLIALSGSADAGRFAAADTPFPVHHRLSKPADHCEILAALGS